MAYPNLFIAGVTRSATSSLYNYLGYHSDIYTPTKKELNALLPENGLIDTQAAHKTYQKYLPPEPDTIYALDASPRYFPFGRSILSAHSELFTNARVIISLRDPVERLRSGYKYRIQRALLSPETTFDEFVTSLKNSLPEPVAIERGTPIPRDALILHSGLYAHYLPAWLNLGEEKLRVVFYEHIETAPLPVVRGLFDWLQLVPPQQLTLARFNRSTTYKYPRLVRAAQRTTNTLRISTLLKRSYLGAARAKLYSAMEHGDIPVWGAPETERWLRDYFAESNTNLIPSLRRLGWRIEHLPSWLQKLA